MRFPVRRIVLGFAVGAGAGWLGGLLRRPKEAPAGSSAGAAVRMPTEEFGEPEPQPEAHPEPQPEHAEEHAPPRKAVPEMVTPPPGREEEPPEPEEAASEPARPARVRRPRRSASDAAAAVAEPMSEAVREGRAEVAERLAGIEDTIAPPTSRRRKQ
jgi:type IV secretory pathway VirB10-like protein